MKPPDLREPFDPVRGREKPPETLPLLRLEVKVQVVNNNNGERLETYVIPGERGSGVICLNGAAARRAQVGDLVIIISYAWMDFEEAKAFQPKVVFPDENNRLP